MHQPVLSNEVLEYLNLRPGKTVLDCTVGCGGHALQILKRVIPEGRLIGIDWDRDALDAAEKNLVDYKGHFSLVCDNFLNIADILARLGVKKVDACLFDLGVSSLQLENPQRGFSIKYDGPLDMRMDRQCGIAASRLVNKLPEYGLVKILRDFGEERFCRSIAKRIARIRQARPISTTWELASIVTNSLPHRFRRSRIHPATKTFQALRIAVNKELENLERVLKILPAYLNKKARVCVISFHSLEDRRVKRFFRNNYSNKTFEIITKKPVAPSDGEVKSNPRARSAKLRVAERV